MDDSLRRIPGVGHDQEGFDNLTSLTERRRL
jgi:hypothetical protein